MALEIQVDRLEGGVVQVVLDDPESKVITLGGEEDLERLEALLGRLESEPNLSRVVLSSAKSEVFLAGADLTLLERIETATQAVAWAARGQEILDRWRRLSALTVAAIEGAALGGGLEVGLACDMRVAADHAATRLGLPEVRLGLIPALGGTYHLPRSIGLEKGLDLLLTGRSLSARQALRVGLVDRLATAADLLTTALEIQRPRSVGRGAGLRRNLLEENPLGRRILFRGARQRVLAKTGGLYPAPLRLLQAVEVGYSQGRQAALAAERRFFGDLVQGDVARSLVHLFLASRNLSSRGVDTEAECETVAVIGAGFMGSGIAAEIARAGMRVLLVDRQPEALARAEEFCRRRFQSLEKRAVLSGEEAKRALDRIEPSLRRSGLDEVDLVVEAVFEDEELKRQVLRELEEEIDVRAVIGTNTSTIPIGRLATALKRPERLLGIHFFSPVHRMPLVEIIRHPGTSQEVLDRALRLARRAKKTPIVVQDGPGFYTSRILAPYLAQAIFMLRDGIPIEAVDGAARKSGFPVGPLELLDEVGIDIAAHASRIMAAAFPDRMPYPEPLERLVQAGRLGRKGDRGFYDYRRRRKRPDPSALTLVVTAASAVSFDSTRLQWRLLMAMALEAVRCLEEGVIDGPRSGDVAAVLGLGFPPFHGGPFRYLDTLGTDRALERAKDLAARHGRIFEPPRLLQQKAMRGAGFYG